MDPTPCLNDIQPGQKAVILSLTLEQTMKRRLLDLGLTPGTTVECVGQSPFGDPAAFLIRGAVIAIRRKDGKNISVKLMTAPGGDSLGHN